MYFESSERKLSKLIIGEESVLLTEQSMEEDEENEENQFDRKIVMKSLLRKYYNDVGGTPKFLFLIFIMLLWCMFSVGSNFWIAYWV